MKPTPFRSATSFITGVGERGCNTGAKYGLDFLLRAQAKDLSDLELDENNETSVDVHDKSRWWARGW